jgi:CRP/FNR family transcriptional regulator
VRSAELLRNSFIFQGLTEAQIEELTTICAEWDYPKGATVFLEGDRARGFYLVASGLVKIFKLAFDGKEQILHIFGPGEVFGEVPVFVGGNYPANAVTLEASRIVFFPKDEFLSLIGREPQIALNMLADMSLRLKRFTHLIENLSLKEVPSRLAAYILFLLEDKRGEAEVRLQISKGHLASVLGTIPETLSRIFNRLTSEGVIEVKGRNIVVLNRARLEQIAAGL